MQPPDSYAATDLGMATPASPATLAAGVRSTIAYPLGVTAQWAVVNNSSPFTIQVAQGQFLGQVAAFTVDVFPVRGATALTILPVAGVGNVPLGTDSTAYVTWFEYLPTGSFPAAIGSGSTPISQATTLRGNATVTMTGGVTLSDFTVPSWAQTIAIRIDDNGLGTANGWQVAVNDTVAVSTQAIVAIGSFQWLYVPVNGRATSITITPLTNGVAGGSSVGPVRVQALSGPYAQVVIGGFGDSGVQTKPGLTAQVVGLAGGANQAIIARPPTGLMLRLRNVSIAQGTAPVAGTQWSLRGTTSGLFYFQWEAPGALPVSLVSHLDVLVGTSGQLDPAEGVTVFNQTAQTGTMVLAYDIVTPSAQAAA